MCPVAVMATLALTRPTQGPRAVCSQGTPWRPPQRSLRHGRLFKALRWRSLAPGDCELTGGSTRAFCHYRVPRAPPGARSAASTRASPHEPRITPPSTVRPAQSKTEQTRPPRSWREGACPPRSPQLSRGPAAKGAAPPGLGTVTGQPPGDGRAEGRACLLHRSDAPDGAVLSDETEQLAGAGTLTPTARDRQGDTKDGLREKLAGASQCPQCPRWPRTAPAERTGAPQGPRAHGPRLLQAPPPRNRGAQGGEGSRGFWRGPAEGRA